jgi:hypothetical protein
MLFMNLQCKNYSSRNMKMNFNISYNFIYQQQFIQNRLGETKSIHQIHNQSIEDGLLRHVSLIHLDINI